LLVERFKVVQVGGEEGVLPEEVPEGDGDVALATGALFTGFVF